MISVQDIMLSKQGETNNSHVTCNWLPPPQLVASGGRVVVVVFFLLRSHLSPNLNSNPSKLGYVPLGRSRSEYK